MMMQSLKVTVSCLYSPAYSFELYPEMTTTQLSQFVFNCQFLHENTDSHDDFRRPSRLISTNSHPFIDFLLGSSEITIGQVNEIFKYAKMKEELSLSCLKQSEYEYHRNHGKTSPLPIAVYYEQNVALSSILANKRLYSYKIIQEESEKENISRKSLENSRYFDFQTEVYFDAKTSELLVSKYILKSSLNCFSRVEEAFLMKKKLIEFHKDSFHVFGQLKHVRQKQDKIQFMFEYIPCITFSEIMRFQFSNETISYLVNKIWMFLLILIQNHYEGYIHRLFKRRQLRKLFDSICFCFDNRLILDDLNLIFERGCGEERLTPLDHEQIISQINIYIKLNKSQLNKYDERIEIDQVSTIHPISLFTFAKIYLTKRFEHFVYDECEFQPKTSNFLWEPQHHTPQNERKANLNEVTTTKKPRDQAKKQVDKKARKEQSRSLNRSRLHESIKKTKCKKAYQ